MIGRSVVVPTRNSHLRGSHGRRCNRFRHRRQDDQAENESPEEVAKEKPEDQKDNEG